MWGLSVLEDSMRIRTAVQGFYEHLISVHSLECVIFVIF